MTLHWADYVNVLDELMKDHAFQENTDRCVGLAKEARANASRAFFIGNGGSAAIASHMAADWQKAGGIPSFCFNDAATLTALGNDIGFDAIFTEPLRMHGIEDDILFAISSSGQSVDILSGVDVARKLGMGIVTLSGFNQNNPLRHLGDVNFYVPRSRYGLVELSHFAILHHVLDRLGEQ